jgi:putative membrane protein
MRTLLKYFIISTVSLLLVSQAVSGITFSEGLYTMLLSGFVLMLANMVAKPVVNILLLPLNLITLGLFKWVAYAITLYLVTLVVPGFHLGNFVFAGYNTYWFSIPAINLSGLLAFVAFSFAISTTSSILHWIFK